MPRNRQPITEDVGHDAFLDIVANLVGILVILIMVLGVRAQDAFESEAQLPTDQLPSAQLSEVEPSETTVAQAPAVTDTSPAETDVLELPNEISAPQLQSSEPIDALVTTDIEPPQIPPQLPDIETPRRQAETLRTDAHEIEYHIEQIDRNIALQKYRRDKLLLKICETEQSVADQRVKKTEQERTAQRIQSELVAAQEQLEHLQQRQTTYAAQAQQVETTLIQNRRTPIAKQVFGREEHFRLLAGRVAFVPMTEMTDALKVAAEQQLWKLKDAPAITNTIGPRHGFFMKYTLHKRERFVRTKDGPSRRMTIELDHFSLLPEREGLGESVEQALTTGSDFEQRLRSFDPKQVTITVWTYPDSFADYQSVKQFLWQRGFSAAARPLPKGLPIGGAPDGSRSAAE